nr:MAG TPA: hypothetical protein [Caudoviricetes sp.]
MRPHFYHRVSKSYPLKKFCGFLEVVFSTSNLGSVWAHGTLMPFRRLTVPTHPRRPWRVSVSACGAVCGVCLPVRACVSVWRCVAWLLLPCACAYTSPSSLSSV